jgi:hypothetical protein
MTPPPESSGHLKRPEIRSRRVEETARLAEENVRANQWRP